MHSLFLVFSFAAVHNKPPESENIRQLHIDPILHGFYYTTLRQTGLSDEREQAFSLLEA
jgi:hypothetical protein